MTSSPKTRHFLTSSTTIGAEDEELDPRIQVELEKLNRASDEINSLEIDLDEARSSFRSVLTESSHTLNALSKRLGKCIESARPYYEARLQAKEALAETQRVALKFERACSMHEAAKEMVQLAELGHMKKEDEFDSAWQEMLNHATMKVNEAEKERIESEAEHMKSAHAYNLIDQRVQRLQRELKRSVNKSRPYFDMMARFNQILEEKKKVVDSLEGSVHSTKAIYAKALRNLEEISDEIHHRRMERRQRRELGDRGAGVGSESPSPPPSRIRNIDTSESFYKSLKRRSESDVVNMLHYREKYSPTSSDDSRRKSYHLAIEKALMTSSDFSHTSDRNYSLSSSSLHNLSHGKHDFLETLGVEETYQSLPSIVNKYKSPPIFETSQSSKCEKKSYDEPPTSNSSMIPIDEYLKRRRQSSLEAIHRNCQSQNFNSEELANFSDSVINVSNNAGEFKSNHNEMDIETLNRTSKGDSLGLKKVNQADDCVSSNTVATSVRSHDSISYPSNSRATSTRTRLRGIVLSVGSDIDGNFTNITSQSHTKSALSSHPRSTVNPKLSRLQSYPPSRYEVPLHSPKDRRKIEGRNNIEEHGILTDKQSQQRVFDRHHYGCETLVCDDLVTSGIKQGGAISLSTTEQIGNDSERNKQHYISPPPEQCKLPIKGDGVPIYPESDVDLSDSESVASVGPVMDDNMLEMLTLKFDENDLLPADE